MIFLPDQLNSFQIMGIIVFSELIEPSYGAEIFVELENDFVSDKFKVEISSVDIVL